MAGGKKTLSDNNAKRFNNSFSLLENLEEDDSGELDQRTNEIEKPVQLEGKANTKTRLKGKRKRPVVQINEKNVTPNHGDQDSIKSPNPLTYSPSNHDRPRIPGKPCQAA